MRRSLSTTTALIASLSLILPAPGIAQEATDTAQACPVGTEPPCPTPEEIAAKLAAEAAAAAQAEADAAAQAEADAAAQAEADAAAQAEADAAAQAEADAAAQAEADAAAQAEADAAAQAEADAAAQAEADAAAQAEADAAAQAEADAAAQAEADAAAQAEADAAAQAEADAAATAEADAAATAAADAAAQAEADAAATAAAEAAALLPDQPDAATGEAPVAEALSASDGDAPAEDVVVIEETVTEDSARSSDEDFTNSVSASAPEAEAKRKKSGLSDGEKAVLLGLGALAVGAIISNGRKVEMNSGDRVVVTRPDGTYDVIKDDNALMRQPGSKVRTETFRDGSTRTTVLREDGAQIVTLYDPEMRIIRRLRTEADGQQFLLIDDSRGAEPVDLRDLPLAAPLASVSAAGSEAALREALARESGLARGFSLAQVRDLEPVRALVPVIDVDAITFETGSAAIVPEQARALAQLGQLVQDAIRANPREIFLVEGHSDAVGGDAYNLALSDRRAESVALALTEYFGVPPENLVAQGYGEQFLKVATQGAEERNRRVSLRRITDLLRIVAAN